MSKEVKKNPWLRTKEEQDKAAEETLKAGEKLTKKMKLDDTDNTEEK